MPRSEVPQRVGLQWQAKGGLDDLDELVRQTVQKEIDPYVDHLERLGRELGSVVESFLTRVKTDRFRLEGDDLENRASHERQTQTKRETTFASDCSKLAKQDSNEDNHSKPFCSSVAASSNIVSLSDTWRGPAKCISIDSVVDRVKTDSPRDIDVLASIKTMNTDVASRVSSSFEDDFSSPPIFAAELLPVWVATQFMDLTVEFDGTNERVTGQVRYTMTWCDPRLDSWIDKVQLPSNLWTPLQMTRSDDTTSTIAFRENGQNFSCCLTPDLEIDTSNAVLRAPFCPTGRPPCNGATGTMVSQTMTNVVLDVPLVDWKRLRAFPSDEVNLSILLACWEVMSIGEGTEKKQVIKLCIDDWKPLVFFGHCGGAEWEVVFPGVLEGYHKSPSSGNVYHDVVASVTLRRRQTYYVWKAIIPLTIAIFLVGCTFAVRFDSDDGFSLRLGVLLAVYFSIFVVQESVMDRLPRTPILTTVDKIANVAVLVVFLAALDSSVLHLIASRIQMAEEKMIDMDTFNGIDAVVALALLLASFSLIYYFARERRRPATSATTGLNFYGNALNDINYREISLQDLDEE